MSPSAPASATDTPAFTFPTADRHDENALPASAPKVDHPTEEALDHGIEESFPASDPVSVSVTSKLPAASGGGGGGNGAAAGGPTGTQPTAPGDDAPPGTPGTGESLCRTCGGKGTTEDGKPCPTCQGTGKVNVGIGGG